MALAQINLIGNTPNGKRRPDVGKATVAGRRLALLAGVLLAPVAARAQSSSPIISDYNTIGWLVYQGDHQLGSRWAIHTEYQARRTHLVSDWQQSLLRGGLSFKAMERLKIGGGYTWLVTHPYGRHPVAEQGSYPEHRFHADIQLDDEVGYMQLSQRLRFEQRYIGIPGASGPLGNRAVWNRQNRIRYQLALRFPLQGNSIDDGEWYATGFDEVFLSFGRTISSNAFNQNRVGVGLGYQFSDDFQLELQYLNQILQHPELDPATYKPVFEFNNGFRLALTYNLTLIAPSERPAERRDADE